MFEFINHRSGRLRTNFGLIEKCIVSVPALDGPAAAQRPRALTRQELERWHSFPAVFSLLFESFQSRFLRIAPAHKNMVLAQYEHRDGASRYDLEAVWKCHRSRITGPAGNVACGGRPTLSHPQCARAQMRPAEPQERRCLSLYGYRILAYLDVVPLATPSGQH